MVRVSVHFNNEVRVLDEDGFSDGRSKKDLKRKRRRSESRSQSAQASNSPMQTRSSQVVTSPSNVNQFSALATLSAAVVDGDWSDDVDEGEVLQSGVVDDVVGVDVDGVVQSEGGNDDDDVDGDDVLLNTRVADQHRALAALAAVVVGEGNDSVDRVSVGQSEGVDTDYESEEDEVSRRVEEFEAEFDEFVEEMEPVTEIQCQDCVVDIEQETEFQQQLREQSQAIRVKRVLRSFYDYEGTSREPRADTSDEEAFDEAAINPARRRQRSSRHRARVQEEPTVEQARRMEAGMSQRKPPRPARVQPQVCCAKPGCGQTFGSKLELRHHLYVDSVDCWPEEAQRPHYLKCGLWWCEHCDCWFEKKMQHDCTKNGIDTSSAGYRANARFMIAAKLKSKIKKQSQDRGGPRRNPEAEAAPVGGERERVSQAADDVPNYWLGGIAEREEAAAADMGELGALDVAEWGMCMRWLAGMPWEDVQRLVSSQTIRPSGRYTGPFQTLYRKCFAMVIKIDGSSREDAKLLSQKLAFLLPRLIYAPVDGTAEINKVLVKRAERFLKGEWEGLYADYMEISSRARGVYGQPTLQAQRARAVRLMEAGLVAKSVGMLGVSKICDVHGVGVMDQLKSQVLFTSSDEEMGEEPRLLEVPDDLYSNSKYFCDTMQTDVDEGRGRDEDNPAASEDTKEDYVVTALRQLPKEGAQDWSGCRYEHIAALTKDQARWIVDVFLNKEPEPEVRWLLTTAKVLPFEKEDGKARACIVGSMMRMFVARVVRLAQRKDMQAEYESFNQFGLGTSSGIDTAFHSVVEHHRAAVEAYLANPHLQLGDQPVLVKYDFQSAFPSIFRDVAFEFAMKRFPQLCRYLATLYAQGAQVSVTQAGVEVKSWQMERGAMQGDPLGGDFFVCAKAEFAKELNRTFPNVWFSWIIDDLTCSMKVSDMNQVDQFIKQEGAKCGLKVNEGKRGMTTLLTKFTATQEVYDSGIHHVMTEGTLEGLAIGTATLGGWNKLLGCPVGSDEFCKVRAVEIVKKKAEALKNILNFQHVQYQIVGLQYCSGVADYMVRMLRPDVVEEALVELDKIKRAVLEETLGVPISDARWSVAKAPSNGIGLAIGDPVVTAAAQHLGSLGGAARVLDLLYEAHRVGGREAEAEKYKAVREAIGAKPGLSGLVTELRSIAEEVNIPDKIINIPNLSEIQSMPRTSYLAEFLVEQQQRKLLQLESWTRTERAGLQSGAQAGAGLWVKAVPAQPYLRTDCDVFRAMILTRLQMPLKAANRIVKCGGCKKVAGAGGAIDFRHITTTCECRDKYIGHKAVTEVIRKMYAQLEVPVTSEPRGLVGGSEQRPADLMVVVPTIACRGALMPTALDVGITDACKVYAVERGSWRVPTGALKAAELYEKRKVDKFEAVKATHPPLGFEYRPIVFEITSARGPAASAWWREITSLAKDKESGFGLGYGSLMEYNGLAHAWSGQTFARHWGVRLSLTLVRAVHRYGLGKISEYILETGRRRLNGI